MSENKIKTSIRKSILHCFNREERFYELLSPVAGKKKGNVVY